MKLEHTKSSCLTATSLEDSNTKSSCLSSPSPSPISASLFPRNTMGLYDPATGKRYEDIISAHLQLRTLSFDEWYLDRTVRESRDRQKLFLLLIDFALQKELTMKGSATVMISFQIRTTGCFAVARLYDKTKTKVLNPHNLSEEI